MTKLEFIEQLAIKAKSGDRCAIDLLLQEFAPLIYKTSKRIQVRYGLIFPIDDIIRQGRHAFIQLTIMTYQPGGKAHYPYFIQKHLHASLVQFYRPLFTFISKSIPLAESEPAPDNTLEPIFKEERDKICQELFQYVEKECNDREKDLIYNCICGHTSRRQIALKYHVSCQRMKNIQCRIISKLRKYLLKFKIMSIDEI